MTGSLFYLSPVCSIFTVIYVKQTIFLWYIVMQLFCITICDSCNVISHIKYVLHFSVSTFRSMCAVPNMAVFFVVA